MVNEQLSLIKEMFSKMHSHDQEHLAAIFSDSSRLIVEAPAGSGKTKILISKIAYNIATNQIPLHKKILALTFSVNAAYKVKKDVANNIPELTENFNSNPSLLNNLITVTNFHGFSRRVLKKYGRLLNVALKNIDSLEGVSDSSMDELNRLNLGLSEPDMQWITDFNSAIVSNRINFRRNHEIFLKYLSYVDEFFLPQNKIPFNGYLVYLLELFKIQPQLKSFYNLLYPIIIVDEFQDTNSLAWEIIKNLVTDKSKLWLFGDSLQRIYGFIGAIEDLMSIAQKEFSMEKIELRTNYRFKDNPNLLHFDKNIRECAKHISNPQPKTEASVLTYAFSNIAEENEWCIHYIQKFLSDNETDKLAILIKQRSPDITMLLQRLDEENITFFYALFNDDDNDYINFHKTALEVFIKLLQEKYPRNISKQFLESYFHVIEDRYRDGSPTEKSLLVLLSAFINNLQTEYLFLDRDEKILYIKDILSNRSLKQSMEYIDAKVILSTVHGAKGLEWDHVIVRGMKNYSFPSFTLCGKCSRHKYVRSECRLNTGSIAQDQEATKYFLEELSVFYVAATRARKTLCMTTNNERINNSGISYNSQLSCFLRMPGIVVDLR